MTTEYYAGDGQPSVLPASQYLHERLQERRARNMRPKRARQSDVVLRRGGDDDIFFTEAEESRRAASRMYDSSPLGAASALSFEAGRSGYNKRRSLGVKDMDGQMDKLSKQNFALKLELDHRREQTLKLQEKIESMRAQVERAEQLEAEHAELLQINSKLVLELEKRDKAVEEAMDIICDLEGTVAELEERGNPTRPSTAQADSGYAGTETQEQLSSGSPVDLNRIPGTIMIRSAPRAASAASHKLNNVMNGQTPARMRREPSIISQKKSSTHALRSVYLEATQKLHPVKSFNSLLSKRDSRAEDEDVLNSPRLSVLSESSFPSLYSPKKESGQNKYAWERGDEAPEAAQVHFRQDSINRVSRWMDSRDGIQDIEETPSKSNRISSPLSERTERGMPSFNATDEVQFQSLNDALSMSTHDSQPSHDGTKPVSYVRPYLTKAEKQLGKQLTVSNVVDLAYHEPLLPPTPDSASTRMLRGSCSSIGADKTLLDTTPAIVRGYDVLEPGVHSAPKNVHTFIELNTAYTNYRDASGNAKDDMSSESDDDCTDGHSDTVKDLSMDYDGFPDGNSILMGTPSRFLRHGKPTAMEQVFFDGNDVLSGSARSPPRRRRSGSEIASSPRKPILSRAETSPTFLSSFGRLVVGASKSTVESNTGLHSHHSGSSGSRTIIQADASRNRSLSSQPSKSQYGGASPSRSLSQRTQRFFRRMSNSQSERSEPRSPREKSPLPTLTSTPSSAYVNAVPKQARRPSTAEMRPIQPTCGPCLPSNCKETDPSPAPQHLATADSSTVNSLPATPVDRISMAPERKNLFNRSDSTKKSVGTTPEDTSSGSRQGIARRRGSIREAVSGRRRPWR
ncbi:hypothetical protein M433DRAFT_140080 [Acidomyces richmondensis BFW]|nr:MAG: hypothetical protein FE78DRAFT_34268 [Acidomyces sp. 'richmondensis']KYG49403.1 hypothetical protein M433DRAFT_140080 [Acidomyces richmondensis BFW]